MSQFPEILISITIAFTILGIVSSFAPDTKIKEKLTKIINVRKRPEALNVNTSLTWSNASSNRLSFLRPNLRNRLSNLAEQRKLILWQAGIRNPNVPLMIVVIEIAVLILGMSLIYVAAYQFYDLEGLNLYLLSVAGGSAYFLPQLVLKQKAADRAAKVAQYWLDFIDLFIISLESGLGIEASLRRVSLELNKYANVLAEEVAILGAELNILEKRRDAYENFHKRNPSKYVKSVTIALIQAERQGSSIVPSLRTIARAERNERYMQVEKKAGAMGAKLSLPLVLFFIPVILAIILGPPIIQIMEL